MEKHLDTVEEDKKGSDTVDSSNEFVAEQQKGQTPTTVTPVSTPAATPTTAPTPTSTSSSSSSSAAASSASAVTEPTPVSKNYKCNVVKLSELVRSDIFKEGTFSKRYEGRGYKLVVEKYNNNDYKVKRYPLPDAPLIEPDADTENDSEGCEIWDDCSRQKAPEGYEAVNEGPDAFGIVYRSTVPGKPAIWCGELPIHNYVNPVFSRKVFVGGIPWDANESDLVTAFNKFGTCRVEWPIKEMRVTNLQLCGARRPKAFGYVYIVYNDGSSIRKLLQECKQELGSAGEWYFKISTRRTHSATEVRQVQVIPWVVSDISCIPCTVGSPDPKKTVFVGGVHGMVTSQMLYSIMNEIFGSVALVELDSDKYQYPLGSGRVTFLSSASFYRAVEDGFFEIRTSKFSKRVQVDPYIQLSKCSQCSVTIGPYFCRERICFNYYCAHCWQVRHSVKGPYSNHRPLERHSRRPLCTASDSNNNNNNNSQLIGTWNSSHPSVPVSYVGAEHVGPGFGSNYGFFSRVVERSTFFVSADDSAPLR